MDLSLPLKLESNSVRSDDCETTDSTQQGIEEKRSDEQVTDKMKGDENSDSESEKSSSMDGHSNDDDASNDGHSSDHTSDEDTEQGTENYEESLFPYSERELIRKLRRDVKCLSRLFIDERSKIGELKLRCKKYKVAKKITEKLFKDLVVIPDPNTKHILTFPNGIDSRAELLTTKINGNCAMTFQSYVNVHNIYL